MQSVKKKVSIKTEVLPEQKEQLQRNAAKFGYSISEYARMKLMDDTIGKEEMIRQISRTLIACYQLAEQIPDEALCTEMKERLSQLWQCLK